MQSGNNLVLQHLALHRDWLSPYITIQWHEPDIFSLLMIIFLLQTSSKTSCNCELNFVHMYSKIIRYYRNVHKWFLTDWLTDWVIETLLTTCTRYSQLKISSLFLFTKKYFDGQTDPKRNKKDEASEEAERKKWSDHFSENIQHVMRDNLIDAIIIVYITNCYL